MPVTTVTVIFSYVMATMNVCVSIHKRSHKAIHTYVYAITYLCVTMPKFTLHLFCYVTKKHYIKKDVLLKGFTSKGCFTEKLYIRSQR